MNSRQFQFQSLVQAHSTELFRYALAQCRQPELAEDLVQETFLRAWRYLDKLQDASAARAWLYTILRREQARHYGRKTPERHAVEIDEQFIHDDSVWASPERQCSDAELRAAIEQLPAKYREPLLLQILGGFTGVEIAKQLGITANAVMVQLFRARQKLREALVESERSVHGMP